MSPIVRFLSLLPVSAALAACQPPDPDSETDGFSGLDMEIRTTTHRDGDDLLSAGLALEGLTAQAPEPADPVSPSPGELRRMAIHAAWTGLYSMTPAGGVGGLLDEVPKVPGREFHAFDQVSGAVHPFRVMVQLPDAFDAGKPCLVVAPASGSRGIYGGLPVVAPWALPAGCAVAYTDKGAGTDYFDHADDSGVDLAGQRVVHGEAELGFEPAAESSQSDALAMPHLHSGDHPEADWGMHVLRAARFGLEVLAREHDVAVDPENTLVIAAGLSNGGGAVLRAAELDEEGLLDAVVAVAPNVAGPGVRPLFDYVSLAALYQPCMLADLDALESMPLGNPALAAAGEQRCAALVRAGLLDEADPARARDRLLEAGFDEPALEQAAVNIALDLWRTIAAGYAAAYLRTGPFDMPCGYGVSAADATPAQRQAWWATHSGIGPGSGIELTDAMAGGHDPYLPGLVCLRDLWTGESDTAEKLRAAVEETRATARLPDIPVLIIHGRNDGLIPVELSSRPYVRKARQHGAGLAYWEIDRAQHFDALLGAPGVAGRYVPMIPYGWAGLDRVRDVLEGRAELGADRQIEPEPAPAGQVLRERDLGL